MISTTSTASAKKKKQTAKTICKCSDSGNTLHNFDAAAICGIIDTCSKAGVKELTFGELHVSFQGSKSEPTKPSDEAEVFNQPNEIGDHNVSPLEKEILQDFEDTQEVIDDPDAFEDRIIDGFLNGNDLNEEANHW